MNSQKTLNEIFRKYPDLICGAVEYAFLTGDINSSEYRTWQTRIIELERQKTKEILSAVLA